MKTYYALQEGVIDGTYRHAGEPVGEYTAKQAKYLEMANLISSEPPKTERTAQPKKRRARSTPQAKAD
ncbi:hypothetical protein [Roseibium sp.]|uniref:hypothetical protein n=1 Tax=Roseibium sp. TaxID=1936156 RepID=UPI003BA8EE41